MSIFFIRDHYHSGVSQLHLLDARVKLVAYVSFAFAILSVPEGHWTAIAAFGAFVAIAIGLSRLPVAAVLGRSLVALPFILMVAPLAFTRHGDPLFQLPVVGWTASVSGVVAVATIMLRAWLCVLLAVVLTSVTQPIDLIRALDRLKFPRIMTAVVLFMYRYLYVIAEEGHRLMRARDARSAAGRGTAKSPSIPWRAQVLGNMVGSLFIRSFERSERIFVAMQARGYDGTIRYMSERTLMRRDWVFLSVIALAIASLVIYARA